MYTDVQQEMQWGYKLKHDSDLASMLIIESCLLLSVSQKLCQIHAMP